MNASPTPSITLARCESGARSPDAPTEPCAGTTGSTITLGWDGAAGASYEVLRSGIRIATVTGTSFTDIGLFPNTPYLYSIRGNGTTTSEITGRIG